MKIGETIIIGGDLFVITGSAELSSIVLPFNSCKVEDVHLL